MKIVWSLLVLAAAACSSETVADRGEHDAGGRPGPGPADAANDDAVEPVPPDAGVDAAEDAGADGEPDASSEPPDAAVDPNADSVPVGSPWLVQCYEGAGDPRLSKVDTYCDSLDETTIPECDGAACEGSWYYTHQTAAYAALFDALDTNDDGIVNEGDTPQRLALFGHSWGGTHVADTTKKLRDDSRIAASRKYVHLAVAFDPFRPLYTLSFGTNVKRLRVLRQSDPQNDPCPAGIGGLRYEGLRPHCAAGQDCRDFDYSLSPQTSFPTQAGGSYLGGEVGHCRVPDVGFPVAVALLHDSALPPLPVEVVVLTP